MIYFILGILVGIILTSLVCILALILVKMYTPIIRQAIEQPLKSEGSAEFVGLADEQAELVDKMKEEDRLSASTTII